jgi:hypothetical protein
MIVSIKKKIVKLKTIGRISTRQLCHDQYVITFKCDGCGKVFKQGHLKVALNEIKKQKNHFCSSKCVYGHRKSDVITWKTKGHCFTCNKEFDVPKWKLKKHKHVFCSRICYNKALSKYEEYQQNVDTMHNEKVYGKIGRKTKRNYESGKVKRLVGKLNPMYGKHLSSEVCGENSRRMRGAGNHMYGKKHSKKSKLKMSKIQQKRITPEYRRYLSQVMANLIINGKFKKGNVYKHGYVYSHRMNKKFYYRSSWEFKYIKFLDKLSSIKSFRYESLIIPYEWNGTHKNYVPDFVVEYKNNNVEIVEIKPLHKIDSCVKSKIRAAKKYCKKIGAKFVVLTEIELKKLGVLP